MSADQTGGPVTIVPTGPLDIEIEAPPSKSLTIRAMAAAALAEGRSALRQPLFSDDTYLMARALGAVGVEVARRGSSVVVEGCAGRLPASSASLELGNAGTPLRLMTAICCLGRGRFLLDGSARMRERPLSHLIDALESLGVRIRSVPGNGCPPVEIEADGFPGGRVQLAGSVSSQYLSALLMTAPCGAADLEVEVTGALVSRPYVDLTIAVMAAFGVQVDRDEYRSFHVGAGQPYSARVYPVEGDASSASYFFAAAAIAGGRVRVSGIPADSKQGDLRFVELLAAMGCRVRREAGVVE
ncbi:MAG TPA: 3-phosphoshikimate 1-carboxyvinyltransferase, partial [Patescibacteria group bacterium]|nr:3-phosphoshikimate 1-carboxyvinyltransferase [Patescibacteria group bacterium]